MPTGIYTRTRKHTLSLEHRLKIGNALRGRKQSEERKKLNSLSHKGISSGPRSEETRRKIGLAQKGKIVSLEQRLKISNTLKGRSLSNEHKVNISNAHKGKHTGSLNTSWKGGITPMMKSLRNKKEYKLWRKAILERDNFKCQKCNTNIGQLCSHHINNFSEFPELRYAIDNGIILCYKCHELFHQKYGKYCNTKLQIDEYLKVSL